MVGRPEPGIFFSSLCLDLEIFFIGPIPVIGILMLIWIKIRNTDVIHRINNDVFLNFFSEFLSGSRDFFSSFKKRHFFLSGPPPS